MISLLSISNILQFLLNSGRENIQLIEGTSCTIVMKEARTLQLHEGATTGAEESKVPEREGTYAEGARTTEWKAGYFLECALFFLASLVTWYLSGF
jgi:hypothetical protein